MTDYDKINDELLNRAAAGDEAAQNELVEKNTGLVHSIVKRFCDRGHEAEDLFQVGCIGLIKAAKRFDISFGVKFSTYAVPMIMGEIKRFIRDDGMIKVSRSLKETVYRAMAAKERLINTNGAEPTVAEIANEIGVSAAELAAALEAGAAPESLYAVSDNGSKENKPLIEKLEQDTDYEAEIVNKLALRQLLAECDKREQKIICMRYFKRRTQSQIAETLGISQVQVSRLEKKIIEKMKKKLADNY